MKAIKKVSGRKKEVYYLYNSVSENYIKESNAIGKEKFLFKNNITKMINKNLKKI